MVSPGTKHAREKGRQQETEEGEEGAEEEKRRELRKNKQNLTKGVRKKYVSSNNSGLATDLRVLVGFEAVGAMSSP